MSAKAETVRDTAIRTSPSDYSKFEIDSNLRRQLQNLGAFECDNILYDQFGRTTTSGSIDGCRWMYTVTVFGWAFLVFREGDADFIRWENSKQLSFEESWEFIGDLETDESKFLPHDQVLWHVLTAAKVFRSAKPFTD